MTVLQRLRGLLRPGRQLIAPLALLGAVGLMVAMRPTPTALERVQARGELVVATRPSLTTVYRDPNGLTGMEYELARGFAERLGVELRLLEVDSTSDLKYAVRRGKADLAASALLAGHDGDQALRYSTPYQNVDTLVMYRLGDQRPAEITDLIGKEVLVRAGSRHADMLVAAQLDHPELSFEQVENATAEQLLALVEQGDGDYALINSNAYAIHRSLFPDLASGFTLSVDQGLAWAFRANDDRSLYLAAQRFLTQAKAQLYPPYGRPPAQLHRPVPGSVRGRRLRLAPAGGDGLSGIPVGRPGDLPHRGRGPDDADQPHRPGNGRLRPHRPGPEHPCRRRLPA